MAGAQATGVASKGAHGCQAPAPRDPDLFKAIEAMAKGDWHIAEPIVASRLSRNPDDVAALQMQGEILMNAGRYTAAEAMLLRCLKLSPAFPPARASYALLLSRQGRFVDAIDQINAGAPADPSTRMVRAGILDQLGDHDEAISLYRGLLAEGFDHYTVWNSLGLCLKTVGRVEESVTAHRQAIAQNPRFTEAYWNLSNLKTFAFSEGEIAAMRALLADPGIAPRDRVHLHFSLGKAYEDVRNFGEAFAHFREGNAAARAFTPHDVAQIGRKVAATAKYFDAPCFERHKDKGEGAADAIFVVGLPRSGSTLVEQILASHSRIEGTQELRSIDRMIARLSSISSNAGKMPYPLIFDDGESGGLLEKLGQEYLANARVHRKSAKPFFVDKTPSNFFHIGFIKLMLPNAKIIDVRRHPLAACHSNYKQFIPGGAPFAFDLEDIALYYRDYWTLMAHFDDAIPGAVHHVRYEDLVADTEAVVRGMLDYIGLDFEQACLRFYDNDRAVRTPSAEQVRRPISGQAVDQWRHYAQWLGPAEQHLAEIVRNYQAVRVSG